MNQRPENTMNQIAKDTNRSDNKTTQRKRMGFTSLFQFLDVQFKGLLENTAGDNYRSPRET